MPVLPGAKSVSWRGAPDQLAENPRLDPYDVLFRPNLS